MSVYTIGYKYIHLNILVNVDCFSIEYSEYNSTVIRILFEYLGGHWTHVQNNHFDIKHSVTLVLIMICSFFCSLVVVFFA